VSQVYFSRHLQFVCAINAFVSSALNGVGYPPFMFADPEDKNVAWVVSSFQVCPEFRRGVTTIQENSAQWRQHAGDREPY
jgi:hypothetical protein